MHPYVVLVYPGVFPTAGGLGGVSGGHPQATKGIPNILVGSLSSGERSVWHPSLNQELFVHFPPNPTILTGSLSLSLYGIIAYIHGGSVKV